MKKWKKMIKKGRRTNEESMMKKMKRKKETMTKRRRMKTFMTLMINLKGNIQLTKPL